MSTDQLATSNILGVVMAGGRNTRYGGLKAYAEVGGQRIIDRVISALEAVADDVVIIANDVDAYAQLGLPMRPDQVEAGGALAGLLTALRWAEERGRAGILTIACDMPFASVRLLERMVQLTAHADVVSPSSGGRRGVEPLFSYYSTRCVAAIERAVARGDHRMISFFDDVRVTAIPLDEVRHFGDPAVLFMNVNTPDELVSAQRIALETGS
ncbi:MAG: molybdenum cofactor guanylyltransferase [Gemmatimonadota bacterium]